MYESIYEYAKMHKLVLPKFRKEKKIEGYIKLSSNGDYEGFEKIPTKEIKRIWCPHMDKPECCIICEKFEYIFLKDDDEILDHKRKNKRFITLTKEGSTFSKTLEIISNFLGQTKNDPDFRNSVIEDIENSGIKSGYISFRIDNVNAENKTDWEEWFDKYTEEHSDKSHRNTVISELTGNEVLPIVNKFPKNRAKAAGSGISLYSNQHRSFSTPSPQCSFVSYGWVNGIGCPMSQEEADAINAGLKYLLDSDANHNSNFGFIYWYDRKDAEDLITRAIRQNKNKDANDVENDREKYYQTVLNTVFTGTIAQTLKDQGKFHLIDYNMPEKGRISLSKEYSGTCKELYDSLHAWYADSAYENTIFIDEKPSGTAVYTLNNLYAILIQCLNNIKAENLDAEINNEYGQDNKHKLMEAMLFNSKIPMVFLQNAIKQVTRSYICGNQFTDECRSRRIFLQLIKAGLLRADCPKTRR